MSFILDALKKSENDRQRQSGPALFEVRVPPPKSRFPLLAAAIISLLVVNVGVVAWLVTREPAEAATAQVVQAAPQAPAPAPPVQAMPPPTQPAPVAMGPPAGTGYPPPAQAQGGYYSQPGSQSGSPPGSSGAQYSGQPQGAPPPGYPNAPSQNGYPPPNNGYQGQPQQPAYNAGGYAPPEPQLSEGRDSGAAGNPDDYAPARQPAPGLFGLGRATRSTESGLPTYEEASSRGSLPQLRLDMHSYAADPTKRFILVNMKRMYEGQTTTEGVKVESITTDAAILSYQGTKFVLNRD